MKLQVPFVQLPLVFDAPRLLAEVDRLGESAWRPHPQGFAGNSALPLIAVNGDPSSDSISGPMRPTAHLDACPYLRQILASIGAVWGRSRLMRLSGHAEVPMHADLAYYWRDRVRVHVPIQTQPTVRFQCGDAEVNMAEGECWIFDTWRLHRVINANPAQRIHLVADTVGSERFWEHASGGRVPGRPVPNWQPRRIGPDPERVPELVYESENLGSVMTPWELREHLNFLLGESIPTPQMATIQQVCARFNATWLGLWARYGPSEKGWSDYRAALEPFSAEMQRLAETLLLRNGMRFLGAFRAMIVQAALSDDPARGLEVKGDYDPDAFAESPGGESRTVTAATQPRVESNPDRTPVDPAGRRFDRPVIILSSPRSGSTLLFETLMRAPGLHTVGGESHVQIEGLDELHPAARNFDSNRLDADAATPELIERLRERFEAGLRDRDGGRPPTGPIRLLEKTPKNALRIPFLRKVFPDAHFVYLYRDPREVLSSMIEAWTSGNFRTYPRLPGWQGPAWSLVLVPGWREWSGRPLPEIVARQWEATTRILLDDLAAVTGERVHRIRYDRFLADPQAQVRRLCNELDLAWDLELEAHLPHSRYTMSAPAPEKWRRHEREIEAVMPLIEATRMRAESFLRDR
ncbi:MAG TPA: sulfotransferase [Dokdonella sp.]|uniref:sulfotransferase n=1 Tax=Dokdonella sp. TaxID=2291710 RepID=UPI002B8DDF0B|nr:sulfotransferase [Dokdonella sp.]HOX72039.1 sulfotransferase [Dokdonella sp.]